MESIGPIITLVLSLAGLLLKIWQDGQPARTKENRDEEIQKGRTDIASGNTAAVSERIDRVQPVPATGSGDPAGVGGGAAGEIDASTLARLVALGCGGGEAAGESGVVQVKTLFR